MKNYLIVIEICVIFVIILQFVSCNDYFGIKFDGIRVRRNINTKVENENLNDIKQIVDILTANSTENRLNPIKPLVPGNDLFIGECGENDKMLYIDNTVITNDGPSVLNGTIEVYIDTVEPIKITCIHIYDQIEDGTGGKPSLNSGGVGQNWVKIDVEGKYGKGFHFKTYVFGVADPDANKNKTLT